MDKHYTDEEKERKPLKPLLHLYQTVFVRLQNFENSQQTGKFNKFWKSTDSCKSYERIQRRRGEDEIEGDDGQGVYGKPPFKVLLCDFTSISVYGEIFVDVSSVERNYNVYQK